MINDTIFKAVLGLTQDETAMLLGITRAQWAMFATGRRDIPLQAKLQLAEVVSQLQKHKQKVPLGTKLSEAEKKKTQAWLLKEYKATKHKQQYLQRKIEVTQHIRKECDAALKVAHYILQQKETEFMKSLAQSIAMRVETTLSKHSLKCLHELELKKETTEMLKNKIEEKLKLLEK